MTRTEMILRNRDVLAGLLFLLIAAVFGYASDQLPMGTAVRMGSGYFPALLSGALAVLGALTLLTGLRNATPERAVHSLAWSRVAIIAASALVFVFGLERIGFPLSVFGTVFLASTASRAFRLVPGLALAAGVAVFSWILFAKLLGLPFRLLGSWFGVA